MRNWKVVAPIALCAAAAGMVYAQQREAKGTLAPQDYVEIEQLYVRYNYGIDTHADGGLLWATTFTVDGIFHTTGRQPVQGREALTALAKARPNQPGSEGPQYFATNIRIEPSPEGARGSAYFFYVPIPKPDKPASITSTGTYEDELVKTAEGWRFKKRTFYANQFPPSMLDHGTAR